MLDVLDATASAHGELDAYIDGPHRISYSELASRSAGVGQRFSEYGVKAGDVVAISLPSCIEYALCYLGSLRLGAITTGINPRLGKRERTEIIGQCLPAIVIGADGGDETTENVELERGAIMGIEPADPEWRAVRAAREDVVAIVWTSGTSGSPKGAVFDHQRLEATARSTGEMTQAFDRRLSPVPFAHAGYMTRLWDEIENAIANVIVPDPWSAGAALEVMEGERITVGQGVPTQWELMLRHPDVTLRDTSTLRLISTGASRVSAGLVERLQAAFRCPVIVRYATTEASVICSTSSSDPPEVVERSVGRPGPGIEVRSVDDNRIAVPVGRVGMIEVRSQAVMRGYFRQDETPVQSDGWLVTGDLGSLLKDGRIQLVGRRSEMYIRGGYNVYPLEVENVLASYPGVAEAAVVGIPDDVLGSTGVAFVTTIASSTVEPEVLQRWCRRELADYKAPDRLVFLSELPRNEMGKVDKAALVAMI
jgi:acyl-CoA synthetase (AMP-forming)/AMP-acid ligase II